MFPDFEVTPISFAKKDLKKFIGLSWDLHKNTGLFAWVPPLIHEQLNLLSPKKNPFFDHAEAQLFIARREGRPVGRISAQRDALHEKYHQDGAGFFGFFECENNPETARALLQRAEAWLRQRGCKTIRGPFSYSINEEVGFVIKGYQHPPYIQMGQNPPYYNTLMETCGLKKIKDLLCWFYDGNRPVPEAPLQIAHEVEKHPGLTVRNINPKKLKEEIPKLMEVFNSAWAKNWGFVPLTDAEVKKATKDLQLIIEPQLSYIAEVNGDPAAICLALPNINSAIADLNGRLFPFGLLKLLYRIKRRKIHTARLMALGIKKEYRGSVLGGLSVLLYTRIHALGVAAGYNSGELSWTLEDNEKINAGIQFMGADQYKTYRVYEKTL